MLKINRFSALLAVSIMMLSVGIDAQAHVRGGHFIGRNHSHPSFGFYLGLPFYPGPYYPYYPYYYPYYPPGIMTVPSNPPAYIERGAPQSAQPLQQGYWYYCTNPEGYYPYVQECPSGWRQVDPIPPSPR